VGVLIGAAFGAGLVSIWWAFTAPAPPPRRRATWKLSTRWRAAGVAVACGVVGFVLVLTVSRVVAVAVAFGALVALLPSALARHRQARRRREFADSWPDAVDHLASAVRAGLSLPEALTQLGERGPAPLQPAFVDFGRTHHATGRFDAALDELKATLADPVGDRVIEALRLAHHVGGGDLGRVLRSLSGFLRDDQKTRGEIESRQSWTVNGARLAVAAPWLVLVLMSLQPGLLARFDSAAGAAVLVGGAAVSAASYRAMVWLGRLPTQRRVLA
jgi:tight adherence protein B